MIKPLIVVLLAVFMLVIAAQSAAALTNDANTVNGIGVMYHITPDITTLLKWNGTTPYANITVPFIRGKSEWIRVESSPSRDQSIIMANYLNGTGQIIMIVYNGSDFIAAKNISTLLASAQIDKRGFDMAYFDDGSAMMVGHNASANGVYQVWNGTNFTSAGIIPFTNCTGIPQFIDFAAGKNGSAFVVTQDDNGDVCANRWNGSAWVAPRLLDSASGGSASTRKNIEINTESISGNAMFSYETSVFGTIGNCAYDITTVPSANGWCSEQTYFDMTTLGDVLFLESARHRMSDRILFGFYQAAAGDINTIEWSGTTDSFSNSNIPSLIDASAETGGDALVAVGYTGDAGMLVYDDVNADNPSYSMCNSTALCADGTWNLPTLTTGAVNCGEAEDLDFVTLRQNPFNNRLMLIAADQGAHTKCMQEWNGAGWNTAFTNLEEGAELSTGIDFDFSYDKFLSAGMITRAWLTNTSTPSSPAAYSTTTPRTMSVSWNITGFDITNVNMTHNFFGAIITIPLNFSAGNFYFATFVGVAAGNYSWFEKALTSDGKTNTTDVYRYEIVPAVPVLSFVVTPSLNVTEGDVSSVTCSSSDPAQAPPFLYRGGNLSVNPHVATLPCGTHPYSCLTVASQNFTNASAYVSLNVVNCDLPEPPVITPITGLLVTAKCPNETTSRVIVFIGMMLLLIGIFLTNELFFKIPVLSALVGIGIIFYGYTMVGCSSAIGTVYIAFGVMMVLHAVSMSWR